MSIDLLPFSALESAPPAAAPAEGHTLTLQLRLRHAGAEPMTGTMAVPVREPGRQGALRAEAVAADATPLTLTF